MMNWFATCWMVAMVIFLIVEGACPFHLVSIWFAIGALVSGIAAMLDAALWLQIALFLVVSCGLLVAMLPLVKKFVAPKIVKTNVEGVIGTRGYVTEAVDNIAATGQVKLGGMYWTARSEDGSPIETGTLVQVERIEGVKVFVTAVKKEATVS
jgi:membrane protein implicated in regulation of membrane protease activity